MKAGSIKSLSVGRKDLFLLAPDDIHEEDGWNVRINGEELETHIRQLADSIKEIGVLQPITVYMNEGKAVITDGHCRLQAVKLAITEGAEIKSIPVRTEEKHSNDADRVLSMLTRNSGKSLSMPEQAEVVKRLLSFGWTAAEISRKTGYSRQHTGNLVAYLSAPSEVHSLVNNGQVSPTMAIAQVKKEGAGALKTINAAVQVANNQGKSKATAKHVVVNACAIHGHIVKHAFKIIRDHAAELYGNEESNENGLLEKSERIEHHCDCLEGLLKKKDGE